MLKRQTTCFVYGSIANRQYAYIKADGLLREWLSFFSLEKSVQLYKL